MERNLSQQQDNDSSILSNNFGGLNLTASPLNIPYTDSPALLNVDVDVAGNIEKRKGTVTVGLTNSPASVYTHPVTTSLGYNFIVAKQQNSLFVYQLQNDVLTNVFSHLNVFSSRATESKPYFLLVPELEPRLLILTGVNAPVHLKFVEQSATVTSGSLTTSLTVPNAQRFANVASTTTKVFVNRVLQNNAVITYSAGTLNVSNVTAFSGTVTVDVIGTVWQWWAESLRWTGGNFYDTKSRFNVTKSDQNLEISKAIRSDAGLINGNYGDYPIYLYQNSLNTSLYTRTNQPDTADKYGFGNGSIYIFNANNFLQPTPFFATFGDVRTGCTPSPCQAETVYINRARELRFNYDTEINAADLLVTVDGQPVTANYSATPTGTRQYHTLLSTGSLNTSPSVPIRYVRFTGSTPIGVSATSIVRLINTNRANVGTAASTSLDSYTNGSAFPVYGLGLFADYGRGSFPAVGAIFQGRLVLSGMRHDPSRVVFSAVNDTVEAGTRFNYFQVTDDLLGLDTDPFDMVITSNNADDFVNGLVEWQNSLFILTRRAVFRASGGNNTLAPSRRFVNFVSSLGLVNQWSVVRTDVAIYYLSDFGVFNLVPRVEDGEYVADEKSLKIRKLFNMTGQTNLAWMSFDNNRKLLYVALPNPGDTATSSTLLVYNTFRDSWTRYESVNRFRTFTGHQYVDRATAEQFILVCTLPNGNTGFVRLYGSRYADYLITTYPAAGNLPLSFSIYSYAFTTTRDVRDYYFNQFNTLPQDNLEDLTVYYDGKRLTLNVDYTKTASGIYLLANPVTGKSLRVYSRRPGTGVDLDPFVVWLNNKPYLEGTDYTLTKSSDSAQTTINLPSLSANTKLEYGYAYLSYYTSPMFVNERLGTLKRTKHLYLFMDNELGQELYGTSDVWGNATLDEIVGVPKTSMNVNVAINYSNTRTAETSYDLYGYRDLIWDSVFFDSFLQADRYILLKETLKGVGYSHQVMLWSYDTSAWRMAGYQLDFNDKGKRYKQAG